MKNSKNFIRNRGRNAKILLLILAALIVINYPFLDETLTRFLNTDEKVVAERIIDGDTFETETGKANVRLLDVNTPEKGDFYYDEAKSFLESEILGKNVTLKFIGERYDKYGRILAYVFLDGKNINNEMVERGFANYYFYSGKDKYSGELLDSWNKCMENNIGLCEKSENRCSSCVKISGSSVANSCSVSCDITGWSIRGEGREKFIFSSQVLQPKGKTPFVLDLSNTDGSLFLRDDEGKLVEWKK
ncbi:MAG: thermonuclease family protein [Nanoarchaeota archaeon]